METTKFFRHTEHTEIWEDRSKLVKIRLEETKDKYGNSERGRVFLIIGGETLVVYLKIDISDFVLGIAKDFNHLKTNYGK